MHSYGPTGVTGRRLYLRSLRASVRVRDVLDDPLVAVIVVEDSCWRFAEQDWLAREPRRWHWRKKRRWEREYPALCEQRDRIRALARRCGLATV